MKDPVQKLGEKSKESHRKFSVNRNQREKSKEIENSV